MAQIPLNIHQQVQARVQTPPRHVQSPPSSVNYKARLPVAAHTEGASFLRLHNTDVVRMQLTEALLKYQLAWPHMHYFLAVLCLVAAVYKLTFILLKRKSVLKSFDAFPGPPAHLLFGNVLEVTSFSGIQQCSCSLKEAIIQSQRQGFYCV